MSEFKTKEEWESAADQLFADGVSPQEINSIVGEYNGPEGTFTVQQAKKSKRGWTPVDKNKRGVRNAKRVKMEKDQSMGIGDTVEPRGTTSTSLRSELGAGKGDEIHHRVSLIQNTPFFDGLSEAESREFVSWVNDQGWDIGNQPGNPEIVIPKKNHLGVHAWMRNNGIEGARGPQKRLTERFKGMDLDQRKNAFRDYMYFVQEGVDEHMLDTLGDVSVSTKHNNAQKINGEIVQAKYNQAATGRNLGDIPSGPRAGQRMPVNRRTIGDSIISDLQYNGGSTSLNINAIMTKANMPALGGFTHHSRTPSVTADQSTYTPPKLQPSQTYTLPDTPVTPKVNRSPSVLENVGAVVNQAMPAITTGLLIGGGFIKFTAGSLLPGGI